MADAQVHPSAASPQQQPNEMKKLLPTSRAPHSSPPPGTYIVLIPKDQILRPAPPPRGIPNLHTRRRRNCCCCCFYWLLSLVILLAVAVGLFFFIARPKAPKYSVQKISIHGFNLTTGQSLSPRMDITLRAQNPNNKIGIYYTKGSSVVVTRSDSNSQLCSGLLPNFFQSTNNVTVFLTTLTASGLNLSTRDRETFVEQQKKRKFPLRLNFEVPVKIKIGSIKTWTMKVKGHCDISVDELTKDATIVSKTCDIGVKLWA